MLRLFSIASEFQDIIYTLPIYIYDYLYTYLHYHYCFYKNVTTLPTCVIVTFKQFTSILIFTILQKPFIIKTQYSKPQWLPITFPHVHSFLIITKKKWKDKITALTYECKSC